MKPDTITITRGTALQILHIIDTNEWTYYNSYTDEMCCRMCATEKDRGHSGGCMLASVKRELTEKLK